MSTAMMPMRHAPAPAGADVLVVETAGADALTEGDGALAARVRLGSAPDTQPTTLAALATDPAVTVRAAVALNAAAPDSVQALLAGDVDARVRTLIARRLATLIPSLPAPDRANLEGRTLGMLLTLVADETARVRAAIADVVQEMPQAPREIILRLAADHEISVSEPVLRLSPLLSPEDLLGLMERGTAATRNAIARRDRLDATVCDAIASGTDEAAITALLANRSAGIREATLDALVLRAADRPGWHAPLVRRPQLSERATRALSEFITTALLDELAGRADIAPAVAGELRRRLAARQMAGAQAKPAAAAVEADLLARARRIAEEEGIHEATVLGAVQRGEAPFAAALLATAAGVQPGLVERAAKLRSAKGLVALVWRAGFSMRLAGPVQVMLARLAPDAVLRPAPSGGFPLSVEEMRWQIAFLARLSQTAI